jgi:hypothetical protein
VGEPIGTPLPSPDKTLMNARLRDAKGAPDFTLR